jgi:hypothetical protein
MLFEMVGQTILFEKILKRGLDVVDTTDTKEYKKLITQYICDFFAFMTVPLPAKIVHQISDWI